MRDRIVIALLVTLLMAGLLALADVIGAYRYDEPIRWKGEDETWLDVAGAVASFVGLLLMVFFLPTFVLLNERGVVMDRYLPRRVFDRVAFLAARILAAVVDLSLFYVAIPLAVLSLVPYIPVVGGLLGAMMVLFFPVYGLIGPLLVALSLRHWGHTPGKWLLQLRLQSELGPRAQRDVARLFSREFLKLLGILFGNIGTLVAVCQIAWGYPAWYDRLAKFTVYSNVGLTGTQARWREARRQAG